LNAPPSKSQREKFASAYDDLKSQGVPEYAVYIKEKDASEKEWKFVGSMAVPRNTKVEVAIYENESNLVKVSIPINLLTPDTRWQ
jgi:hypothetical protein